MLTQEQHEELFNTEYQGDSTPPVSADPDAIAMMADGTVITNSTQQAAQSLVNEPSVSKEWTEETMVNNPQWMADAHTLKDVIGLGVRKAPDPVSEYMSTQQGTETMFKPPVGIDALQAGMAEAVESYVPPERRDLLIDGVELDDAALSNSLMDWVGRTQWNTTKMGTLAFAEVEDWSEEQQVALVRSFTTYNEDLPVTWASTYRGLAGLASDPLTYFGIGFIVNSLSKLVLKPAAVALLRQRIGSVAGITAISAAEGGVLTGFNDAAHQKLEITAGIADDYDYVRSTKAVGIGMAGGAALGWSISTLLSRWATRRLRQQTPLAPVVDEALPPVTDEALPPVTDEAVPPVVDEAVPPVKADETPDFTMDADHVRVNVNRMLTSDDMKAAVIAHADEHGGPMVVQTLEEAHAAAVIEAQKLVDEVGGDFEAIVKSLEGDVDTLQTLTKRMGSSRIFHATFFNDLVELTGKILDDVNMSDMTAAEMSRFLRMYELAPRMSQVYVGGSEGASRLLGQRRIMVEGKPSLLEGGETPQRFLPEFDPHLRDNIDTPEARAAIKTFALSIRKAIDDGTLKLPKDLSRVANRSLQEAVMDGLISAQTASMVGGGSTLKLAAISGFVNLWYQPALQLIGAMKPTFGSSAAAKSAKAANANLRYHAMAQYIGNIYYQKQATTSALKALIRGEHITDPHVTQIEGISDKSNANKGVIEKVYDHTWAAAHTILMMIDEYTKNVTGKSMAMADGFVAAREAGHTVGSKKWTKVVSKAVDDAFDEFGAIKGKENQHILTEMRERTYTTDLKGSRGAVLNSIAHSKGTKLGQLLLLPFKRAPVNTVSEGIMMIPGSGLRIPLLKGSPHLSAKQRWIKEEGDPIQLAKLKARKLVGAGIIISLWGILDEDEDFCVGSGPVDWDANKAWQDLDGRLPYSCKNPDTGKWVSYKKAEPFATIIGMTLDARRIYNDSGMERQDELEEILYEVQGMLTKNLWDKNFLSTATEFLEAIGDGRSMFKFLQSLPTRIVPNAISQSNPDPYKREAENLEDMLKAKIHGVSMRLGQQYDKYGRARLKPDNRSSMFNVRDIFNNPVGKEEQRLAQLQGNDTAFSAPSTTLSTGKDNWQDIKDIGSDVSVYSKYMKILGQMESNKGLTLYESLNEAIQSDAYLNLPDTLDESVKGPKLKFLQNIHDHFRELAFRELKEVSPAFAEKKADLEYKELEMWRQ